MSLQKELLGFGFPDEFAEMADRTASGNLNVKLRGPGTRRTSFSNDLSVSIHFILSIRLRFFRPANPEIAAICLVQTSYYPNPKRGDEIQGLLRDPVSYREAVVASKMPSKRISRLQRHEVFVGVS